MVSDWLDTPVDLTGKKVWVAGHTGLVGSAVVRRLIKEQCEILTAPHAVLDLTDQAATQAWMKAHRPDVVVLAAAKVGGICANNDAPADFLYENMMIEANVIRAAHDCGVQKLLFLGSSCIYPKDSAVPVREEALLSGALEPTNEAYAVAKIAGVKLCQSYRKQYGDDFIAVMPCNLYGPHDRFDVHQSHVIPALMMRAHEAKTKGAKTLSVWGSGAPQREFLYSDDLADALVFVLKRYSSSEILNVGSGQEISIKALAQDIVKTVGFNGELTFDTAKPDGVMRKVMDVSRLREAGWAAQISLQDGLFQTYQWYLAQKQRIKESA